MRLLRNYKFGVTWRGREGEEASYDSCSLLIDDCISIRWHKRARRQLEHDCCDARAQLAAYIKRNIPKHSSQFENEEKQNTSLVILASKLNEKSSEFQRNASPICDAHLVRLGRVAVHGKGG